MRAIGRHVVLGHVAADRSGVAEGHAGAARRGHAHQGEHLVGNEVGAEDHAAVGIVGADGEVLHVAAVHQAGVQARGCAAGEQHGVQLAHAVDVLVGGVDHALAVGRNGKARHAAAGGERPVQPERGGAAIDRHAAQLEAFVGGEVAAKDHAASVGADAEAEHVALGVCRHGQQRGIAAVHAHGAEAVAVVGEGVGLVDHAVGGAVEREARDIGVGAEAGRERGGHDKPRPVVHRRAPELVAPVGAAVGDEDHEGAVGGNSVGQRVDALAAVGHLARIWQLHRKVVAEEGDDVEEEDRPCGGAEAEFKADAARKRVAKDHPCVVRRDHKIGHADAAAGRPGLASSDVVGGGAAGEWRAEDAKEPARHRVVAEDHALVVAGDRKVGLHVAARTGAAVEAHIGGAASDRRREEIEHLVVVAVGQEDSGAAVRAEGERLHIAAGGQEGVEGHGRAAAKRHREQLRRLVLALVGQVDNAGAAGVDGELDHVAAGGERPVEAHWGAAADGRAVELKDAASGLVREEDDRAVVGADLVARAERRLGYGLNAPAERQGGVELAGCGEGEGGRARGDGGEDQGEQERAKAGPCAPVYGHGISFQLCCLHQCAARRSLVAPKATGARLSCSTAMGAVTDQNGARWGFVVKGGLRRLLWAGPPSGRNRLDHERREGVRRARKGTGTAARAGPDASAQADARSQARPTRFQPPGSAPWHATRAVYTR